MFLNMFKKKDIKLNKLNVYLTYFLDKGLTNVSFKINDLNVIKNKIKSTISGKHIMGRFPSYKISNILSKDSNTSNYIVSFENKLVKFGDYYLNQDAYNFYKIGIELLIYLSKINVIDFTKFKIEAVECGENCLFCGSRYSSVYKVFYESSLLYETKHNNLHQENNIPFLYNLDTSKENNLIINKDIISQLLFEALKIKFKDQIKFNILEINSYNIHNLNNLMYNFEEYEPLENLQRTHSEDCCIGYGKDNIYSKAIKIYNYFYFQSKNEMILIISNKYIKIKLINNSLNFFDIKDELFNELYFDKNEKNRIDVLEDISVILSNKFNVMMDSNIYKNKE